MEESLEKLAAVESMDNGKPINSARGDIGEAIGCLRYYAGWADKIEGRVIDTSPKNLNYTRREPVMLSLCHEWLRTFVGLTVLDWSLRSNHPVELRELLPGLKHVGRTDAYTQQPLMMWAWKIGPAIACGNTVVIKTAETTPLSALIAAELIDQAGFPPGVINIITGYGNIAGSALSRHMDVDKIAFTGSTAVGRQILKDAASSNLKKVTLELGGKSPNIVFNDADLEQAVPWIHSGIFSNMGQNCCAGSRIYVQSGIYDAFVQKLNETVRQRIIGPPEDEKTVHGAQVSKAQLDRILRYASI